MKRQMEEDSDREILTLKTTYERKLQDEKVALHVRSASSLLRHSWIICCFVNSWPDLELGVEVGLMLAVVYSTSITVNTSINSSMLLGGSMVRTLDSGPRGRDFDSRRLRFRVTRSTQPSIPPV